MIEQIRNKLTFRIIVAMLAVFVSLSFALLVPHSTKANDGANRDAELKLIEQYVSQSDMGDYWVQTLDEDAARSAGTVALMKEIIVYQNAMMYQVFLTGVRDITQVDVNMDDYPLARAYFNEPRSSGTGASVGGVSEVSTDPHPCGEILNPVPNRTPVRENFDGNGHIYFISNGYYLTPLGLTGDFGRDYTKDRSYSGPYGVCPSPLFRNQGVVASSLTSYWIQRGEPNPVIPLNPFDWPYPGWPIYVAWRHLNY